MAEPRFNNPYFWPPPPTMPSQVGPLHQDFERREDKWMWKTLRGRLGVLRVPVPLPSSTSLPPPPAAGQPGLDQQNQRAVDGGKDPPPTPASHLSGLSAAPPGAPLTC